MIAFYLPGDVPIYLYSLILALGATLGLAVVAWNAGENDRVAWVDCGLCVLAGSLALSRVVYVWANSAYFQAHRLETIQVFRGGLAWPGALGGGILGLVLYAWVTRRSLAALADGLVPLATVIAIGAWLGCWAEGCAYGETAAGWWALPARDEWGTLAPRFPLQFLAALMTLALFAGLDQIAGLRARPGKRALLWGLGMALEMAGLTLFRADPAQAWHGLRLDTWAALVYAVLFGIAFAVLQWRSGDREEG